MRYNSSHINGKSLKGLNRCYTIILLSLIPAISLMVFLLGSVIGCSTNYQGPLRFSGNAAELDYNSEFDEHYNNDSQRKKLTEYVIDTILVTDTLIEECPLEIIENTYQVEVYKSCPIIFDTVTTGALLTEALKRLRVYISEFIKGNLLYRYVINEFLKFLEIYLPDILDRILEILKLDEIIERQRYPEIYIYPEAYNSEGREKSVEFSSGIQLTNHVSKNFPLANKFNSNETLPDSSIKYRKLNGFDTVH